MFRSLSTAVLLLLLALPGVALAQGTGTLAGRVLESDGVTSVIGATVRIDGTNLGARTDIDGDYRIIGVPIGTYPVTASFVGFTAQTITGVDINAGQTRQLNFTFAGDTQSLEEVVVTYEAPLITTNVAQARVVTGEQLENLPIRDVAATVALQGGIVNTEGSSALNIRGGRSEEVQYFVDGVRVTGAAGQLGVNQQAIEQQEVLIGTIPARYGDVQSGVISITTKTGRADFFGSVEAQTSTGLDSFGYNLASASLGGPILKDRLGFFLSVEGQSIDDASPYGINSFQLNDASVARINANPQLLEVVRADGTTGYVPFPVDIASGRLGTNGQTTLTRRELQTLLRAQGGENGIAAGDSLNGNLVSATERLTAADFDEARGKNDPVRDLTVNGNLNFTFGDVGLRLGAGYVNRNTEPFSYLNSLFNADNFASNPSQIDRENIRFYGTLRQRLSNAAFYQLQGEYTDYKLYQYPQGFSNDLADVVRYGSATEARNEVALRYYTLGAGANGTFNQQFAQASGPRPGSLDGTFSLPGSIGSTVYQKRHEQQARFSGSATAQVGVNQIEFGGEFQQETNRRFTLRAFGLNRLATQADGSVLPYDSLTFANVRGTQSTGVDPRNSYGYNFNGTEEVSTGDQDINGFFPLTGAKTDTDIAPYRPVYYAGYIQDKIEFQDLVVQLGLRVDVFDNNTLVLRDIFAPTPIFRAGSLVSDTRPEGVARLDALPAGIEDDYAVYFNGSRVVGYRDLDGNFYDTQGGRVALNEITQTASGSIITDPTQTVASSFVPYDAQVTVMPRVGVSFPVTDRALFFASYNVTSQRPTEFAFAPIAAYDNLTGQSQTVPNSRLEPEQTTQYEIGFRQRLTDRSAVSLSGFYRTQENKVTYRVLDAGFPAYGTFLNADFTTTQGAEVNFDLRRTNNLQLNANYTLSFAQGTGSDAQSTSSAAFRGDPIPQFLSPSDFDQRHTANVTLDYRLPSGGGPMVGNIRPFENFGINLIGQFGSGQRYTQQAFSGVRAGSPFEPNAIGTINGTTLPTTTRVDLRVDRSFNLGFSDSRLRAYVQVQNLLDTQNTLSVYRGTGVPDDDGFLGTSEAASQLDTPGALFAYQQYATGPVNVDAGGLATGTSGVFYSAPRQVRLGFLFDF